MTVQTGAPDSNPFATRFVRPGALSFEFPPGQSARQLVERLAAQGWRGAIVGPHGSGKSTLLAALLAELRARGHVVAEVSLHEGQRWLGRWPEPFDGEGAGGCSPARAGLPAVLAIDGYEQLGLASRWLVHWRCRRRRLGLVVTTHRPTALPALFETRPTADLAARLVDRLLGDNAAASWTQAAERSFAAQRGNVREVLFELYDLYEAQRIARS